MICFLANTIPFRTVGLVFRLITIGIYMYVENVDRFQIVLMSFGCLTHIEKIDIIYISLWIST